MIAVQQYGQCHQYQPYRQQCRSFPLDTNVVLVHSILVSVLCQCVCVWGGDLKIHLSTNVMLQSNVADSISVKNGSRNIKSNRCKAGKVKKSIDLQRKRSGDGRSERCEVESQPCCFSGNHCLLHNCCCALFGQFSYTTNCLPSLIYACASHKNWAWREPIGPQMHSSFLF